MLHNHGIAAVAGWTTFNYNGVVRNGNWDYYGNIFPWKYQEYYPQIQ
jgi:hypothetical protein